MLSEPTSLKRRSDGAGTASGRRDHHIVTSLVPTLWWWSGSDGGNVESEQ